MIFIDNTSGLLAASSNIHKLVNKKESILLNSQHGSGYYEFKGADFYLSEKSPAYDHQLIGFYKSKLIRPHYPVNGKNYRIKKNNFKDFALIVEGADIFTRKINSDFLKSSKYTINLYQEIIDVLNKNDVKSVLRRHPKSKINWENFDSKFFIENLEKIPSKYIPNPNDFDIFILVGLGHSLIYPLLNSNKKFFIIANPRDYNLSKDGIKLYNFLIQNRILINPSALEDFKDNYENYLKLRKNMNLSEQINKKAEILENWVSTL